MKEIKGDHLVRVDFAIKGEAGTQCSIVCSFSIVMVPMPSRVSKSCIFSSFHHLKVFQTFCFGNCLRKSNKYLQAGPKWK